MGGMVLVLGCALWAPGSLLYIASSAGCEQGKAGVWFLVGFLLRQTSSFTSKWDFFSRM